VQQLWGVHGSKISGSLAGMSIKHSSSSQQLPTTDFHTALGSSPLLHPPLRVERCREMVVLHIGSQPLGLDSSSSSSSIPAAYQQHKFALDESCCH
jgi:hypothetical protein